MHVRTLMARLGAFGILMAALGAASSDESLRDIAGPPPAIAPTMDSIQQNVLRLTDSAGRNACVNCHTTAGGRTPPMGLDLSGDAHAMLVNVPSRERPQLMRVKPGDP